MKDRKSTNETTTNAPGALVGNLGEPVKLTLGNLRGVAAETIPKGASGKVWVRLAVTSDSPIFHRATESLEGVIIHHARQSGTSVNLRRAEMILIVIRPDNSAELWIDNAAQVLRILSKRSVVAGTAVFQSDIADIIALEFPAVKIDPSDRIICLFRQGWRFALFFDFNPEGTLSVDTVFRTLGALYRNLAYRQLYDTISNEETLQRLREAGWFPFVEIIGEEFRSLADFTVAKFQLSDVEAELIAKFDDKRLGHLLERWLTKPHLKSRETLLNSAIKNFKENDPVAVIKTVLTEIEGILVHAYQSTHGSKASIKGKGTKIERLIDFASKSAEQKTGDAETLLLSRAFAEYLREQTFANFNPTKQSPAALSRHSVGHGMAATATYTQARALQALLTLDQVAFYT